MRRDDPDRQQLVVMLHDEPVGDLRRRGAGGELTYRREVVERSAGLPLLSLSLPVRATAYAEDVTRPFIEGLLPEGLVRERLCRRFRIDVGDIFGLLWEIGRDCAGAVSLVPPGEVDTPSPDDVQWLTDDQMRQLLDELPVRPLGDEPAGDIRISLAGAQDKVAVVIGSDGRVGLPRGRTPSTHILKPGSYEQTRRGRLLYPGLMENEAFCLQLAAASGVDVCAAKVAPVAGERVLVVERYDRAPGPGGVVRRVHQEDLCQALGRPPHAKYEDQGGPGIADAVGLLRRSSAAADGDVLVFLERLAFNLIVGNNDAHAKNTSLLHLPAGIRLAPAYDVVCTAAYPHLSGKLAMSVGGQFQADQVTPRHWSQLLDELGLNTMDVRRRMAEMGDRVRAALPAARAGARTAGADHEVLDEVTRVATGRAERLAGLAGYAPRPPRERLG